MSEPLLLGASLPPDVAIMLGPRLLPPAVTVGGVSEISKEGFGDCALGFAKILSAEGATYTTEFSAVCLCQLGECSFGIRLHT